MYCQECGKKRHIDASYGDYLPCDHKKLETNYEKEKMTLITIYLPTGKTLRYEQCDNFKYGDDAWVSFDYISASRGVKCNGKFFYQNIAGISKDSL